jgi:hypothetical protein
MALGIYMIKTNCADLNTYYINKTRLREFVKYNVVNLPKKSRLREFVNLFNHKKKKDSPNSGTYIMTKPNQ